MFDYQRGKDIFIGTHRIPVMVFLGGVPRGNRNHPNDWATKGNPTSDWVKKGMTRLPTIHHPNEKSGLNIYSNPKKWCKRIKVQPFQIGCYFCVKNWGLKKKMWLKPPAHHQDVDQWHQPPVWGIETQCACSSQHYAAHHRHWEPDQNTWNPCASSPFSKNKKVSRCFWINGSHHPFNGLWMAYEWHMKSIWMAYEWPLMLENNKWKPGGNENDVFEATRCPSSWTAGGRKRSVNLGRCFSKSPI